MDMTVACIRLMDAIRKAALETQDDGFRYRGRNYGVFIVDNARHEAVEVLHKVVETLDHRIEIMDAKRTNLNDLEVWDSPMREKARFAFASEKTYLFVLRGWVAEMGADPRMHNFRESFGGAGLAMVLSDTAEGVPKYFVTCDLSAL